MNHSNKSNRFVGDEISPRLLTSLTAMNASVISITIGGEISKLSGRTSFRRND
ncbi:MAG: hypothetical protein JXR34_08925 [Bacteroidales bacterium]|nr:hypothetical protein [Bacteroidales bacterium]